MKRAIVWAVALLAAGVVGGFVTRMLWPKHLHASSASSAGSFADAIRSGGAGRTA